MNQHLDCDRTSREDLLAKLGPNQGVIGINGNLEVFEGYDSKVHSAWHSEPEWVIDEESRKEWIEQSLSPAEKKELADEMIQRWESYREKVHNADVFSTPLGVEGFTGRGFEIVTFRDEYDHPCSIQESSRAVFENEDGTVDDPLGWIWLGVNDAMPKIMKSKALALDMELPPGEISGWMPYPLPEDVSLTTRMHLNETQVRGLVARLTQWLETGNLTYAKTTGAP